jgi:F-type H+-transporting ATPase subunit delta
MLVTKIAESYAKALISIAISNNKLEFVTEDINELLDLFKKNKELKNFLIHPFHKKESKKQLLKNLIGISKSETYTKQLLMLLIDRSRIDMFEVIAEKYLALTYQYVKIEIAQVISAFSLETEQIEAIKYQLKQYTNANDVRIIEKIDEDLISGIIIKFGSKVLDLSLKGRLKKLALQLETTIF